MSALPNCHDNAILWERELKERQQKNKQLSLNKENQSKPLFIDPCQKYL